MDSLIACVREHARRQPERLCVRTVSTRHGDATRSFGQVWSDAGRAAAFLKARGVRPGDCVVLIGTHDPDLHAVWLGAVWLGAVPTILAEPSVRVNREVYAERLFAILERTGTATVMASRRAGMESIASLGWTDGCQQFFYDDAVASEDPVPPVVEAKGDDLLLLQHSSGTTGLQKGVMLTHEAVMRHAEAHHAALGVRDDDCVVSWLPLYHDMGMIACFVCPLIAGIPVIALSPFEWVAAPSSLLHAVSQHRGTLVWLPNFAFALLAGRCREAAGSFQLQSLRAVVNCSEPVTAAAMQAFFRRFATDGLSSEALQACYAMAENVFAVTTTTAAEPARTLRVRKDRWLQDHLAVSADDADAEAVEFTSSGVLLPGCELRIVDRSGAPCPALAAGRVLIRSGFLFTGYFRRDDLNDGLFDAEGFYDTGDVGFIDADGHLFLTGRGKDIVIVGGKNIYPHDVEAIVGAVEGVYPGRMVCFGVTNKALGTEALIVLFETDQPEDQWSEVARRVRMAIPERLDLDAFDVRAVPRGELRKSTSGKLARDGNRSWYLEGRFGPIPPPVRG